MIIKFARHYKFLTIASIVVFVSIILVIAFSYGWYVGVNSERLRTLTGYKMLGDMTTDRINEIYTNLKTDGKRDDTVKFLEEYYKVLNDKRPEIREIIYPLNAIKSPSEANIKAIYEKTAISLYQSNHIIVYPFLDRRYWDDVYYAFTEGSVQ